MLLASIPVLACITAVGIYIRTSPFEPELSLRHLAALAGCDAAQAMGLAPARSGEPGYHARNDADLDGIACAAAPEVAPADAPRNSPDQEPPGGAGFARR
ncbi:Excalibur calcium-binding domain-containing protein [Ruegeria marina]|uniref:Excalibur calcium-binding domain-containing protein n=2 Tax=Ruegeria marina TaxID=639004 RepID=A0A1G6LT07_9RHOB|nr:Excalibur calcium-binding domain-containing protein [Ruegeria marina]